MLSVGVCAALSLRVCVTCVPRGVGCVCHVYPPWGGVCVCHALLLRRVSRLPCRCRESMENMIHQHTYARSPLRACTETDILDPFHMAYSSMKGAYIQQLLTFQNRTFPSVKSYQILHPNGVALRAPCILSIL